MARRPSVLLLLALTVAAGACSATTTEGAATSTTAVTTTTTIAEDGPPITVDWVDTADTPLPNGWEIRDCGEGARTHVCVHEGSEALGDIELLPGYPLDAADDATEPQATARAWANRMIDHFRSDRAEGCADFTFTPLEVTPATVGGREGARGGFTLRDGDGRVVEHVVNHYVLVDGAMTIINTDAYARDGGCLGPADDSPSFLPEHLRRLDDGLLDRIVAGSPTTAA